MSKRHHYLDEAAVSFGKQLVADLGRAGAEQLALGESLSSEDAFWGDVLASIYAAPVTGRKHPSPQRSMAKGFSWGVIRDWDTLPLEPGFRMMSDTMRKRIRDYERAQYSGTPPKIRPGESLMDDAVRRRIARDMRPPGLPRESHRVFYLGTHRANWLDMDDAGEDVPGEVATSWLAKVSVPLFISRRQLEGRKKLPRAAARWALDSGGFTELKMHGGWKLAARDYVAMVRRFRDEIGNLDWCAPMDWMCEVEMLQRTGLTVAKHVERTVASYLELRSMAPDIPVIPVLQGLAPQDYYACAVMFEKHGVDLTKEPTVGLGSVCRRQVTVPMEGPAYAINGVEFIAGLAGMGIRLHGFGFKKVGLENAADYFVSADSMAWSSGAREEAMKAKRGECDYTCPHGKKSCNNCLHYALEWRSQLLGKLGPEWQRDG